MTHGSLSTHKLDSLHVEHGLKNLNILILISQTCASLKNDCLRTYKSTDCRISEQPNLELGKKQPMMIHCSIEQGENSKRFLYEGARKWGDSLKASPDTWQNWPTVFHTIAPASQIALVMHRFLQESKRELKYCVLCEFLQEKHGALAFSKKL